MQKKMIIYLTKLEKQIIIFISRTNLFLKQGTKKDERA